MRCCEVNDSIRVERQARHVESQSPVKNAVPGEVAVVPQAIWAGGLARVRMMRSDDIMQKRVVGIRHETKKTFQFTCPREMGTITGTVLKAVREEAPRSTLVR